MKTRTPRSAAFVVHQRASLLAWLAPAALVLGGCLPLAGRDARLGASSYGCMQRVVAEKVPAGLRDHEAHCLAAGLIARYCSPAEAWLAVTGKELRDLVGPGDADADDARAGWSGMSCAKRAQDEAALRTCCLVNQ